MTVKELRESLRGVPGDSEIFVVGDWSAVDDDGKLTDLRPVNSVETQRHFVDMGLEWVEEVDVLLDAEEAVL